MPENPTNFSHVVQIIAQKPDCSAFLLLSSAVIAGLVTLQGIPDGYHFTYCQAWGLTMGADVVLRVVSDMRAKAYPPAADYLDAVAKGDSVALDVYKAACLAVKAKYPKV